MATAIQTIQFDGGRVEVFSTHAWVYAAGDDPVVGYRTAERRWQPFQPEYDATTHRQITQLSTDDAAMRCGATASLMRQVEAAAHSQYEAAKSATARRIEAGRRSWAAKSDEERQPLNDYAMKTEGHTID